MKMNNKVKDKEWYSCSTPIDIHKSIIFNNGYSTLSYCLNFYDVETRFSKIGDFRDLFVWVPCEKVDLQPGDVVYATDFLNKSFNSPEQVHVFVNKYIMVYVEDDEECRIEKSYFNYYYKLVSKSEVEK